MNFGSLLIFIGLNKSKNKFLIRAQCRARSGPGLQPTGRDVGMPRTTACWRSHRWLIGGWPAPRSCRGARRGHREGAGQGGRGWSTPERRHGVEAMEDASGGGVHWRGESTDGWWQWRHDPAVWVHKREGEGGLKCGQRWWMGGSHCEAAEAVALVREPERRRGLRRWEPVRRTHMRWSRWGMELRLGRGMEQSEAPMASLIQRSRGGEHEREMGGGVDSSVPRGGGVKREGGGGRQPDHGVRMALGGVVRGGSARSWRRRADE
jgi:hypothetical protein